LKPILHISVRKLVEFACRSGDLESPGFSAIDPQDAIRAHQKIQKQRPLEYASEVAVCGQVETEPFIVEVEGRIDGVFEYPDHAIIDEIKTTNHELEMLDAHNGLHWAQAQCYGALYAVDHQFETIALQLTYYHMESRRVREMRREYNRVTLEAFLVDCVTRYAAWTARIRQWQEQRDHSLVGLGFPYRVYRAGQRTMAAAVYRGIRDGGQVLAQAPTGIGKTMAALFPALKAMGEGHTGKLFYLTARTTGRVTAETTLHILRRAGAQVKSISLIAKQKACSNTKFECNPSACAAARGYYDRLAAAREEAFQSDNLDGPALQQISSRHLLCPFEFSLEMALWVDCVIADYNYVFDPRVYLRRFFDESPAKVSLLIDEAHNLIDRSREMFSASLDGLAIARVRTQMRGVNRTLLAALGKLQAFCERKHVVCLERKTTLVEPALPLDLVDLTRRFIAAARRWLAKNSAHPAREDLLNLYFSAHFFTAIAELYTRRYVTIFEAGTASVTIKLFCIDPSAAMAACLQRVKSAIFFSSTLTPMRYFREVLGCTSVVQECDLASPFPPRNCAVVVQAAISTLFEQRQSTALSVAESIEALVRARRGNYLCFFPSYAYLQMVLVQFMRLAPEVEVVAQTPELGEAQRQDFLAKFTAENAATLIGFAVMGGIFGEGIDLVGERLTGAAIVGVGLPGISIERDLIRAYYDRSGRGYDYAYLYPGLTRVLQAAGRVIRSETDRGVILLIDERFARRRYKPLLPAAWWTQTVSDTAALRHCVQQFREGEVGML
jgi:DNA excision repair protein ERCC-2